jgi:RNA polymerase sigma-70 factor (ECF subfamily)
LLRVLDPDVVFRMDAGGAGPLARSPVVAGLLARSPIVGAGDVAREILATGAPFAPLAEPAIVNGAAGAIVRAGGRPRYVVGFTVANGRIAAIDLIGDPAKVGRFTETKGEIQ